MTEEQLTAEEQQLLEEAMKSYGSPEKDEKHNVHTFLNTVSKSTDTTKTGNLTQEEIGFTPYSQRTYKKLALDSAKLCDDDIWEEYFNKNAEILTATSLSKEGFLMKQATTSTKQIADVTPRRVENKGWFRKKDSNPQQSGGAA